MTEGEEVCEPQIGVIGEVETRVQEKKNYECGDERDFMFLPGDLVFIQNKEAKREKFRINEGPLRVIAAPENGIYWVKGIRGSKVCKKASSRTLRLCVSEDGSV